MTLNIDKSPITLGTVKFLAPFAFVIFTFAAAWFTTQGRIDVFEKRITNLESADRMQQQFMEQLKDTLSKMAADLAVIRYQVENPKSPAAPK